MLASPLHNSSRFVVLIVSVLAALVCYGQKEPTRGKGVHVGMSRADVFDMLGRKEQERKLTKEYEVLRCGASAVVLVNDRVAQVDPYLELELERLKLDQKWQFEHEKATAQDVWRYYRKEVLNIIGVKRWGKLGTRYGNLLNMLKLKMNETGKLSQQKVFLMELQAEHFAKLHRQNDLMDIEAEIYRLYLLRHRGLQRSMIKLGWPKTTLSDTFKHHGVGYLGPITVIKLLEHDRRLIVRELTGKKYVLVGDPKLRRSGEQKPLQNEVGQKGLLVRPVRRQEDRTAKAVGENLPVLWLMADPKDDGS